MPQDLRLLVGSDAAGFDLKDAILADLSRTPTSPASRTSALRPTTSRAAPIPASPSSLARCATAAADALQRASRDSSPTGD